MCVYTGPHILFIHSSINGHLGYVHILAIVNKAAISIRGHYLLKLVFLFSLDKQPEREPLVHMVVLFLIFWGTSILFSMVAAPTDIPTNGARGFLFLYILANSCYFLSFWWQWCWQGWAVSHRGFDLYFPDDQPQWASSHGPVDHLYIFGKEGLLPIFFSKGKFCILLEKNKCAQALRFNKSNFHGFTLSETFLFLKQYVHGGEEYNDY